MKISNVTNDNIVIQARDEADYQKAQQVAIEMEKLSNGDLVNCSADDYAFWVQLTACWDNYQASQFKELYKEAKKCVLYS